MNKAEFLRALEDELAGLPPEERSSALQYYGMYFDDAGPEREQEVLQNLGSPKKVAAGIRASAEPAPHQSPAEDVPTDGLPTLEASAPAKQRDPFDHDAPKASAVGDAGDVVEILDYTEQTLPMPVPAPAPQPAGEIDEKSNNKAWNILWILLAILFLSGPLAGVFGVIVGVLVAMLCVFFVPLILGIAFVACSLAVFAAGVMLVASSVGTGLLLMGNSFILLGLGLLCAHLGVWLLRKVVPAAFRGCKQLVQKIFSRWRKN